MLVPDAVNPVDDRPLVDLIHDRVLADPDAVAVRAAGRALTYGELWERYDASPRVSRRMSF